MDTEAASPTWRLHGALEIETSGAVLLFDYHRTPYAVGGEPRAVPGSDVRVGWLGDRRHRARLHWAIPGPGAPSARWDLDGTPVVAKVVGDDDLAPIRHALGGTWVRAVAMEPARGRRSAAVWTRADGSILLPFEPDEAIYNLWTEAYLGELSPRAERAIALGRRAYYWVRPAMPRRLQIAFRRWLARRQVRTRFPGWPVETALHDLYDVLYGLVASVTGQPVPALAPWPGDRTWALVLTHDVEGAEGLAGIEPLRRAERRHGLVSEWNFVPERYETPASVREGLVDEGCEIGVHGLTHDGHDVESVEALAARLPAIQGYARAWGATGFRAPAMQRSWKAMRTLGFDHDLSFPDTDPFQPCRGGCCSWLPIMDGPVVELPLTLPQDHTMFVILQRSGPQLWIDKARVLRARGGLVQLLVHPDYLTSTGVLEAYEEFLATFAEDPTAWRALPREVSAWWRARAASSIVAGPDGWEVAGPAAADARVALMPQNVRLGPSALLNVAATPLPSMER